MRRVCMCGLLHTGSIDNFERTWKLFLFRSFVYRQPASPINHAITFNKAYQDQLRAIEDATEHSLHTPAGMYISPPTTHTYPLLRKTHPLPHQRPPSPRLATHWGKIYKLHPRRKAVLENPRQGRDLYDFSQLQTQTLLQAIKIRSRRTANGL